MRLRTHFSVVKRFRISGAKLPPPIYAFVASEGSTQLVPLVSGENFVY
jgi:hypothetical protein